MIFKGGASVISTSCSSSNQNRFIISIHTGAYKFVFVSGTYDWSGGTVVGNGLKIRNVDVQQANPPAQNELKQSNCSGCRIKPSADRK